MTTMTVRKGVPLTPDQISQVRSTYRRTGTTRTASQALGVSRDVVAKYTRDIESARPNAKPDLTWQERAACAGQSPEMFFPYGPTDYECLEAAMAICRRCPVREACLQYAQTTHSVGVFGGKFINYEGKKRTAS